jgi:tetratricopeptide (TPR) repeat protein
MKTHLTLELFPNLKKWAETREKSQEPSSTPSETLVWDLCKVISAEDEDHLLWAHVLKDFIHRSQNINLDLYEAIELTRRLDCDFLHVYAEVTERTVAKGHGSAIIRSLKTISDATDMTSLRFLTAWTAFNLDQFELCIEECEPIAGKFAHVYILAGQAHLYLGQLPEAFEALDIATKLAPRDGTAWFLLAKCLIIANDLPTGFAAIARCLEMHPNDLEAITLAAMIGCHENADDLQRISVFHLIGPTVRVDLPPQLILKFIENCALISDQRYLLNFLHKLLGLGSKVLLNEPYQMQNLAQILKVLHSKGDFKSSQMLLDCIETGVTKGGTNQS